MWREKGRERERGRERGGRGGGRKGVLFQILKLLVFIFHLKDYFRCKMEKENFIEKVTKKVGDSELVVQVLCFKILFKVKNGLI